MNNWPGIFLSQWVGNWKKVLTSKYFMITHQKCQRKASKFDKLGNTKTYYIQFFTFFDSLYLPYQFPRLCQHRSGHSLGKKFLGTFNQAWLKFCTISKTLSSLWYVCSNSNSVERKRGRIYGMSAILNIFVTDKFPES